MNNRLLSGWSWTSRFSPPPLVDAHSVQQIYRAANSPDAGSLLAQREVQQILLGERQSAFVGRGYEFAENRLYSAGDEARFINWRLLARTGQLYRKTFYEERRPPVWLILDRSASMRFGTRTRLKIAQAAQLALFHLFLAQRHSLLTGAVLIDEIPTWFAPAQDRGSQQALIRALCAATPPLAEDAPTATLRSVLEQTQVQLAPGCIVILYSDFHELQASDMPMLHALAQTHTLYARHIIDVSEQTLPADGEYDFARQDEQTTLDCSDSALTAAYAQRMQHRHNEIATWFQQAGIAYARYRADDDILSAA
ncbi:MAG: DUF58 domain-containing protein [Gammaproteobacteria bacterium]|nr:DUF58 domain-containing protein [Gammaproteobacteria bacterium]